MHFLLAPLQSLITYLTAHIHVTFQNARDQKVKFPTLGWGQKVKLRTLGWRNFFKFIAHHCLCAAIFIVDCHFEWAFNAKLKTCTIHFFHIEIVLCISSRYNWALAPALLIVARQKCCLLLDLTVPSLHDCCPLRSGIHFSLTQLYQRSEEAPG